MKTFLIEIESFSTLLLDCGTKKKNGQKISHKRKPVNRNESENTTINYCITQRNTLLRRTRTSCDLFIKCNMLNYHRGVGARFGLELERGKAEKHWVSWR